MPWSDAKTREAVEAEFGRITRPDFSMPNGRTEDYKILEPHLATYQAGRAVRILAMLEMSDQYGMTGFPVSRLEHALQTATLAFQAGKDEEYVVCALLHDFAESLVFDNHAEVGAELLKPFISEANYWMLYHHSFFQMYHMGPHIGVPREMREQWRGHPHFERTLEFCDSFDALAFCAGREAMPLEAFRPMVERVTMKLGNTAIAAMMPD
ncbi:HD domain-containing protein [Rhizorhapis suberifaciens]|uniref:Putative HD phosphohydrolase n=1 Tax=Rhizorhapis suberifaciens TaxID=13656 RepID=A0A840HVF8_9SPHN|nr:HD domain-containing protein [Rhizorhapis suberifaciens]MBB4641560.1 putative HD phosphohydrolase [Rhizorhapis suberifaciens]